MVNSPISCFFAYPSHPPELCEVIEDAIKRINETGVVYITGWKTVEVVGKFIIEEVYEAISKSDIFICDLTYPNPNVLFELGYAIAKNKRVWITLDTSLPNARQNYDELYSLVPIGYCKYNNVGDIVNSFFSEQPYLDLKTTIYSNAISSVAEVPSSYPIVYLKTDVNTESSSRLTGKLRSSRIKVITDDPEETRSQTLTWYIQNIYYAVGVIIHFIDDERAKNSLRNAKCAFVCGLALGLDKQVLVLAHSPYNTPIDYHSLIHIHSKATQCLSILNSWIPKIEQEFDDLIRNRNAYQVSAKLSLGLQRLGLGDFVAENETDDLLHYFIPTSAYTEALQSTHSMLYVGRKGTGKTANLYKLADEVGKDARTHVCIIKPVDYELEGILQLLQISTSRADRGYLLQSLWKFLIYTELAQSIKQQLENKPEHFVPSQAESALLRYISQHPRILDAEFTVRMEEAIYSLCQIDPNQPIVDNRRRVSEILHNEILAKMRELIGNALEEKQNVYVLVDNLDKAWKRREDLPALSEFLFDLLGVAKVVAEDFQKKRFRKSPVNLSLIIFLRSDIFAHIMKAAREADKMSATRMIWDDPYLLQRVIEQRFITAADSLLTPRDVWIKYFEDKVKDIPTKDYIVKYIIPRPRDIIFTVIARSI